MWDHVCVQGGLWELLIAVPLKGLEIALLHGYLKVKLHTLFKKIH